MPVATIVFGLMHSHFIGIVVAAVGLAGATGCEAYAKAANGAINSGAFAISDGSIKVKNASSVPVCKVTVFHSQEPERADNDLSVGSGKALSPGAEATVNVPHVGKAETPTPAGVTYGLRAYGCNDRTAYTKEPGSLLMTIPTIDPKTTETLFIR